MKGKTILKDAVLLLLEHVILHLLSKVFKPKRSKKTMYRKPDYTHWSDDDLIKLAENGQITEVEDAYEQLTGKKPTGTDVDKRIMLKRFVESSMPFATSQPPNRPLPPNQQPSKVVNRTIATKETVPLWVPILAGLALLGVLLLGLAGWQLNQKINALNKRDDQIVSEMRSQNNSVDQDARATAIAAGNLAQTANDRLDTSVSQVNQGFADRDRRLSADETAIAQLATLLTPSTTPKTTTTATNTPTHTPTAIVSSTSTPTATPSASTTEAPSPTEVATSTATAPPAPPITLAGENEFWKIVYEADSIWQPALPAGSHDLVQDKTFTVPVTGIYTLRAKQAYIRLISPVCGVMMDTENEASQPIKLEKGMVVKITEGPDGWFRMDELFNTDVPVPDLGPCPAEETPQGGG